MKKEKIKDEKKYEVIYADPPWRFRVHSEKGKGRSAENHYPTMKLEDICALPVADIAADDCALFMWATFPNLREAFDVIDAWGVTYKTVAFVWVKQNKKSDSLFWGMGDVPRVELFARQKTPGWDTWGNEVENDLELAA